MARASNPPGKQPRSSRKITKRSLRNGRLSLPSCGNNYLGGDFLGGTMVKILRFKCKWRRKWQTTPVFSPRESHGQKSLAGYSPWGLKEWDMTERLTLSLSERGGADDMHLHFPGGGTNPDRVRELSRITELIRPPWITHGGCSG